MRRYHNNYENKGNDAILMFLGVVFVLLVIFIYMLYSNNQKSVENEKTIKAITERNKELVDSLSLFQKMSNKVDTVYVENITKKPKLKPLIKDTITKSSTKQIVSTTLDTIQK